MSKGKWQMKMAASAQSSAALAPRQVAMLAATGIALWFVAAMLLRQIAPLGVFDGSARIALYALTVPGTWPFVRLTQRMAGLAPAQLVPGIAVVTIAALFADSIVFAWFPWIYGAAQYHRDCAAAVFWGAGVGLLLSFIAAARQPPA